ncbi:MAG TPA: radical SAM protein [Gemmatimonadales bacterium]|nr:radical SAM protein [Gemmatimonadales bacterium]HRZ08634.1 radical SAM protein [Gemmatimonadales bacterium]
MRLLATRSKEAGDARRREWSGGASVRDTRSDRGAEGAQTAASEEHPEPGTRASAQLSLLPPHRARLLPVLGAVEGRAVTFEAVPTRSILNSPAATHMPFWSVNPYIGCEFGCTYCYARDTHRWTMERMEGATVPPLHMVERGTGGESFENRILVKIDAPAILRRTLDPTRIDGAPIVIGTATDPYQPAERRFRITRGLLESLLPHRGLHLGIITKSPLITRDIDLLVRLAERHTVSIHISLAALEGRLVRRIEARSPAPHARLRALGRLAGAGLDVGLLVAPIIPGVTDGRAQLTALFRAAKEAGARRVAGEALRLGPAARRHFLPHLAREFPDLAVRYNRRYGQRQTAGQDYTAALTRRLDAIRQELGLEGGKGL